VLRKHLVILVLAAAVTFAQAESVNNDVTPLDKLSGVEIMEKLKEQVESLRLRAKYTIYEVREGKKTETKVSCVRDGLKYHVVAKAHIGGKVVEYRQIYDGTVLIRYTFSEQDKRRSALVFPGRQHAMYTVPHGMLQLSGLDGLVVDEIELDADVTDSEFRYIFPDDTVIRQEGVSYEELEAFLSPQVKQPEYEKVETAEPLGAKKQFEIAGGDAPILVPVRMGMKDYTFLVDTGASITMLDKSLRKHLGLVQKSVKVRTHGNDVVLDMFDAPSAYLGPFGLQGIMVMCADLNLLEQALGEEMSGVIGMNLLKSHVVQIDFDRGILEFDPNRPESLAEWGREYPITYNMGIPQIKAKVNDEIELDFTLDTGSCSTGSLIKEVFNGILAKKPDTPISESLAATAAGTMKSRDMRVGRLSLGENGYKNLIMGESGISNLGTGFLSRHKVTFDFPNSKVYFKKGRDFDKVDEADMSGLYISRKDNVTKVYDVKDNSPADKAKIRSGDIVLKINDKDASQYSMMEIRRLRKSGDGKEIKLLIERDEKQMEVSFKLKKEI